MKPELDPVWEDKIYGEGSHLNRYPFDAVVSFIYRWRPRDKPVSETAVVEVGSGAGNNLWFAAREGFRVAGIEGSATAVRYARERFKNEKLMGDLREGNFLALPWEDDSFDIAIDRHSLCCVSLKAQKTAISELKRVLRSGGVLFYNGYSDQHTSAKYGHRQSDGRVVNITSGTLAGVGGLTFCTMQDIEKLFAFGWEIMKLEHCIIEDAPNTSAASNHAEWRVIVRKR